MHYRKLVDSLRKFRVWHRFIGTTVALFVVVSAATGILLGWKKNVDLLQPAERQGTTSELDKWASLQTIVASATQAMDSVRGYSATVDKLDVRPGKGIVKVLFKEGYWEVQVDGVTAKPLSVSRRHSDWLEKVHDGSIIDDIFKIGYTNMLGLGLFILSLSGLWLWYGPKVVRKIKND